MSYTFIGISPKKKKNDKGTRLMNFPTTLKQKIIYSQHIKNYP